MTEFQKYIQRYLDKVPSEDWIKEMQIDGDHTTALFSSIPEEKGDFAYAEGKWSVKVLLQHMIDAEKVFQYRAMRISRNDQTNLPGYDEDFLAANCEGNKRTLSSLIEEQALLRKTGVMFFKTLQPEMLLRTGNANGNVMSVETIGRLIVGHNIHHLDILKERYLSILND